MRLFLIVSLAVLFTAPQAAFAQQVPSQDTPVQGAPVQAQPCAPRSAVTPPEEKLYRRFMRRLGAAQLTPQQQQQIQQMVAQYSQSHPAGTPLDRPSMQQLRSSVTALLTPQQRQLLEQAHQEKTSGQGGLGRAPCSRPT